MTSQSTAPSAPPLRQLMFADGTPRRAFATACVVGTVLIAINHGDTMLAGVAPPLAKVVMTYVVPYCVTTWGAVTGKRAQLRHPEART